MYFEFHCKISQVGSSQSCGFIEDSSKIITDDKILAAEVEREIITFANKTLEDDKSKKKFIGVYDRYCNEYLYSVEFLYFSRELKSIICNKTISNGYALVSIVGAEHFERFYFIK